MVEVPSLDLVERVDVTGELTIEGWTMRPTPGPGNYYENEPITVHSEPIRMTLFPVSQKWRVGASNWLILAGVFVALPVAVGFLLFMNRMAMDAERRYKEATARDNNSWR